MALMHPGSVGVVVVNYSSLKYVQKCLDCLKSQKKLPDQVIVIDNSVRRECELLRESHPGVVFICTGNNIGFAAANNRGIELCETNYVALLNPDAFPEPDWLEKLTRAADQAPDFAAFGSLQLCNDDLEKIDGIGDCYHISGLFWRECHGKALKETNISACEIFSPCAAAALYRKSAIKEIGGFDEEFFCYGEDVDLGFRLRLAGFKAKFVPEAVVYHEGGASSGGERSEFATYYGHRNLVWVFIKNMPGILFWLFLPLHVTLNIIAVFTLALRGQGRVALKAKSDAFRDIAQIWRKRKKMESIRRVSISQIYYIMKKSPFHL
jgi:GT2 family glycosyltransferase